MFEYTEAEFRKTSKPYPGQKRYYGYQEFLAQTLDKKSSLHLENPPALGKVGGLDLLTWYAEAQALHPVVYPDKDPKIAPSKRAYCKTVDPKTLQVVDGSFRASKVPKISADYLRRSLPIVQRQVLLGGLRLAGMLNEAANKGKVKPIGSKTLENLTRATAIELRDRQVK